jgi:hypothetical protein
MLLVIINYLRIYSELFYEVMLGEFIPLSAIPGMSWVTAGDKALLYPGYSSQ